MASTIHVYSLMFVLFLSISKWFDVSNALSNGRFMSHSTQSLARVSTTPEYPCFSSMNKCSVNICGPCFVTQSLLDMCVPAGKAVDMRLDCSGNHTEQDNGIRKETNAKLIMGTSEREPVSNPFIHRREFCLEHLAVLPTISLGFPSPLSAYHHNNAVYTPISFK